MQILFISLGCDKNLVDSEHMLGLLTRHGYTITDDETCADIIVINTSALFMMQKKRASRTSWRWQSIKRRVPVKPCL